MNDSMNVAGNAINTPNAGSPRTRSKFPTMSYHLFNTERFGEYGSNFVMECVEGDKIEIRSGGRVQSYTLKAPLMQSISKKKDYYLVPMECILPFNWDKFYTNPVVGDDVPDDCGCGVSNFWYLISLLFNSYLSEMYARLDRQGVTLSTSEVLTGIFRLLCLHEYFYSDGSLISTLGCHGGSYFYVRNNSTKTGLSYDQWFDAIIQAIVNIVPWFQFTDSDGNVKYVINDEANYGYMYREYPCVNMHGCLQYFRDDLTCVVSGVDASVSNLDTQLKVYFKNDSSGVYQFFVRNEAIPYNFSRVAAYQLVNAHYYSNDHIDYVYSAELYRQLMFSLESHALHNLVPVYETFTINGLNYPYDALSSNVFVKMLVAARYDAARVSGLLFGPLTAQLSGILGYFCNLFAYRRSLRFVDYFTGSRTRPLAVGDVNVDVQSGSPNYVSVVDVSRNIQRQRFFNAVNRFGRKFEEYIQGLSGVKPAPDYHNPFYLAHTSDSVYGIEVENTGADQLTKNQSVTSRLSSNGARFQFSFEVDRPCVCIGITYYDINRAYLNSCDRQLFHMNRFDMFNPFMQFIGDQEVMRAELGRDAYVSVSGTFGYQIRHMEYKQRFPVASGGFRDYLPGYLFDSREDDNRVNSGVQNVDFIRSLNEELDRFYVSLTGYSLGSYFHFIVDNDNFVDPSRPMAFAPTIL